MNYNLTARILPVAMGLAALGLCVAQRADAAVTMVPIALNGFNTIGIDGSGNLGSVNAGDTGNTLDGTFDFYAQGVDSANTATGLPVGTFTSAENANTTFALQDASATNTNNALLVTATSGDADTLTLGTPAAYSSLAFLDSGFNGAQTVGYTLNYANGTSSTGTISAPDNFGGGSTTAYDLDGRYDQVYADFENVNANPVNPPYVYEYDVNANPALTLSSITFTDAGATLNTTNGSNSDAAIFAISGAAVAVTPEPSQIGMLALMAFGLGGLLLKARRRSGRQLA